MAAILGCYLTPIVSPHPPSALLPPRSLFPTARKSYSSSSSSTPMESQTEGRKSFLEFPHVSDVHKDLMVDLVSAVESRLDSYLLPCMLLPDVQRYENENGTAQASLHVRSGISSSRIDFILGSWLYCKLPTGGALNITSLSAYLNPSTDAPNFLIELIQSTPTSMVLILDLPPRKDLVLNPDYLTAFYETTQLDQKRQLLQILPEVTPYFPSSLYIRSVVSPVAILIRIQADRVERMDEVLRDQVSLVAGEVLGVWLDVCACGERGVGEAERAYLEERDRMSKSKTIEIDLGSNLPRLFGQEVADRVLQALQEVF